MTRAKAGTGHLQDMTLTVKRHRAVLSIDPLCMCLQGNVSLATRKQAPPPLLLDLIHAPPPPANNQPGPQHMPDSHPPPPDNDEARPQDIPESPPPGSQDNEDENPSTGSERTPIANKRTKKERMKFLKSLSSHPAFISLIKTMERIKVSFSTPCWNVCLIFS
jgi:hypothetical protein